MTKLAKLWLNEIVNDTYRRFYFKVLGIYLDNLLFELFGGKNSLKSIYGTVYNRFFRTTFKGALNLYYPPKAYNEIIVSGLFHDKQGELETHKYFPTHICRVMEDNRVHFNLDKVCFVESNHNDEPNYKGESQLIQLTDILAGSISQCFDLSSLDDGKNEVAKVILPLLKRIMEQKPRRRSRYDFFHKYDVSFFPRDKLTKDEFLNIYSRAKDKFFKNRRLLLEEYLSGQLRMKLD